MHRTAFALLLLAACGGGSDTDTDRTPTDGGTDTPTDTDTTDTDVPTDTDLPPEPISVVSFTLTDPGNALIRDANVTLSRAADVRIVCTTAADPLEQHILTATAVATATLELAGLLADTTYTCALTATAEGVDPATAEAETTSGPLSDVTPVWTTTGTTDGYTVFNHIERGGKSHHAWFIVDPEGRVRWYRVLADTGLDANVGVELRWIPERQQLLAGGGDTLPPMLQTLRNETVWSAPVTGKEWHHDALLLASGDVVGLQTEHVIYEGQDTDGTSINEVAPDQSIVWSWNTQQGIDAGVLIPPGGLVQADDDAWHSNAVSYLEDDGHGPAYFLSEKAANEIIRVDRTTGEVSWQLGAGRDFQLVDLAGKKLDDGYWFSDQHAPDWRVEADGLHALIYDNGGSRPSPAKFSRVIELLVDPDARVATLLWDHDNDFQVYTPLWGEADWLPNGLMLVTQSNCFDCDKVDPDERSAIYDLDPATEVVSWRMDFAAAEDALYRSDRIDACTLFKNARYCPALATAP